jgi:tetratricopeptide (TPR) repeat protein
VQHVHFSGNRTRGLWAMALLFVVCLGGMATAQQRSYNLDDDPLRLGNKALEGGRLEEARIQFEEAVANDHHLAEALCGLATVDMRQGHFAEAEGRYRQALSASGGSDLDARAGLGLLLLRQGRNEEASAEFHQVLQKNPKHWEANYGLAYLALEAGQWDVAHEHLEFGRKKKGLHEGEDLYQHGLALYLRGTGDLPGAEGAALRAQVLNPSDPLYAQLVARIYLDEGHNSLAIYAYEQALNTPGMAASAVMLHELGRLFVLENRFNEASQRFLQAVAVDSTYTPALKDMADLYQRANRFDKAAGVYLRYVALVPEDGPAQLELSRCLGELGRFDQAAEAARQMLSMNPEDPDARFQFARNGIHASDDSLKSEAGVIMVSLLASSRPELTWEAGDLVELALWQAKNKDYEDAITTITQAATLDPESSRIPFQQGLMELSAGQPAAAVESFQRAVTLDPDNAANHLNLGIAMYQAGQMEAAVPTFRQAVALRPELAAARLLLAQVLASSGSLGDAESEYRQVLVQEPRNAKALRGLGFCRLRAADYPAAAAAYSQSVEIESSSADGWAGLGSARLGEGNLDAAETAFAKARTIDPRNIMLTTGAQLLNQAKTTRKDNQ